MKTIKLAQRVRVYQGVLPRPLFAELQRAIRAHAGRPALPLQVGYTKPYWFPFRERGPAFLVEEVILRLKRLVQPGPACGGAEWWVRKAGTTRAKPLHVDKDEARLKSTGQAVHPLFGTIFYVTDTGGPTLVLDQTISADAKRVIPPLPTQGVLLSPKANRLAVFPGELRHGVMASGEPAGTARITLLVNWWPARPTRMFDPDDALRAALTSPPRPARPAPRAPRRVRPIEVSQEFLRQVCRIE